MPSNIFLVGPMGVGKTTIGRLLAKTLGRPFYDSDREIEQRTGASVALIFELENESGFRQRETKMIDELSKKNGIILATGGGAVIKERNRKLLASRGHVIYLYANLEQLLKRTAKDKGRPLLQTADPRRTMQTLLEKRDPLYREIADTVIETHTASIKNIVKQIQQLTYDEHL